MSLDHLLDDADPRDAAEAAIIMANATVNDAEASNEERSDAGELINLGVDELERRFQQDEGEEITLLVEDAGLYSGDALSYPREGGTGTDSPVHRVQYVVVPGRDAQKGNKRSYKALPGTGVSVAGLFFHTDLPWGSASTTNDPAKGEIGEFRGKLPE